MSQQLRSNVPRERGQSDFGPRLGWTEVQVAAPEGRAMTGCRRRGHHRTVGYFGTTAVGEFLARPLPEGRPDPRVRHLGDLSAREREVLDLIARALSNDEIAARLSVSRATVRNHTTRIFRKLDVPSRAQGMVLAQQGGLGRQAS